MTKVFTETLRTEVQEKYDLQFMNFRDFPFANCKDSSLIFLEEARVTFLEEEPEYAPDTLIAYDKTNQEIVGFLTIFFVENQHAHLNYMELKKEHRNKGLGTEMLRMTLMLSLQEINNCKGIVIMAANTHMIRLLDNLKYELLGWE